ncbi:MAG: hypothetical protein EA409_05475 [Saprospirales bacterium]|nr:MAG: hypothetical protein EA409_05475 [Saprospirales bacterium]
MTLSAFFSILQHEFKMEFRHRFSSAALMVYVAAVVFIIYLSFSSTEAAMWNSLFWIVVLFSGLQSGTLAFTREFGDSHLFYYQYVHPISLFFAKIISVWIKLLVLAFLAWFVMGLVLGDPVVRSGLFVLALLLGTLGFAAIFSFLSAIAMNSRNNGLLLAVLGFPVLLPVLLSVLRISSISMAVINLDASDSILTLISVVMLVLGMGLFLFPYLWKN